MTPAAADAGRTGRRPGSPATRDAILEAARQRFSEVGFDKTTIRAVAAIAEVDPALVHHYFGSKKDLFLAATDIPIDPTLIVSALRAVPVDQLGEAILRTVLSAWDSPAGPGLVAAFRGFIAGSQPELLRSFVLDVVLKDIRERIDEPKGTGRKRATLVFSQIAGLGVARKLIAVEPLASMPAEEVVRLFAPNLQRFLTGPL
ncbi:TetR family transcriptional regulator [Smaragdicoccus niigatensis]|uniref:TetR/AcrR family transcriptional regulator n=1 Tax=Smaragdicoccus niigatensis TaxID=359359 RepID=UPI00036A5DC0|nr:TetR family transcriptional regulator [Smaragdicoccus niigatensis]